MRIGIDFDNTLIGYDDVFLAAARERNLVSAGFTGNKQAVRDAIRLLPDGELAWQRLQGHAYGRGIEKAVMFEGVDGFLRRCRAAGHGVFVVSHKTQFGHYDPDRIDLRTAASDWMEARGFFAPGKYAIPRENVFFEGSRAEKLRRIAALECVHFIDDLEEVLNDPDFPPGVNRVLFAAAGSSPSLVGPSLAGPSLAVCSDWQQVAEVVLDE